ncbi:MAG: ABC transporter permease [Acidobacteria bacterium]|nr:ABC transporter permease [Acidobacteriota bacterium]MCI0568704.1 ABC transporter permease [Acidobacteriota bacterium]
MRGYLFRRILSVVPTLLGITLVTFLLLEILPGREMALSQASGANLPSRETLDRLRQTYHLNEPIPIRYFQWLLRLCRWDLGESLLDHRPVSEALRQTTARTLALNLLALSLALAISVPLGTRWAAVAGSLRDRVGSLLLYLLYAFPGFAAALILQYLFAVRWGVLPLQGVRSLPATAPLLQRSLDLAAHLLLPVLCLAYGSLAYLARFTRASVLEGLRSHYVDAARARGVDERVIVWRHAFRNALVPMVTLLGALVPALLGGSILVETIFSWPGMGRLYFESLQNRDYPVVLALTVVTALLTLAGSLLADVLYCVADPRVEPEQGFHGRLS